jgi:alpha-N-acetylglucosaminidase
MLHNFGGNTNLFGRMETVATEPAKALNDPARGHLAGIGLTMEGIEQNPVLYELMTAHTWRNEPIQLDTWLPQFVHNRYGVKNKDALNAWKILRRTVYTVPADKYIRDGAESIIQARPTLDSFTRWTKTTLNYDAKDLLPAWEALIKAADACANSDGFQYDLVDLTRQALANYALPLQQKWVHAYKNKDNAAFKTYSAQFIELIGDMDKLLATRKEFLLGPWVADARRWGTTEKEKGLYEMNAKDLITLWGDENCPLHEYACKQWSGLLNDFYRPRWQQFFSMLESKEPDLEAFATSIKSWEWQWVNTRKDYPVHPTGNAVVEAKRMFQKYYKLIR